MVQVLPNSYFRANFLTMRPNTANDMELESLNKCGTFWYVLFIPILYGFKSVLKMAKTYFRRNFYKLYRNWVNNILLKSYGKCETFSCWWFSLILSRFQVISKMAGSCVLPLSRNRFFKMHRVKNLNFSAYLPELHSVFYVLFFARRCPSTTRISPSTPRNSVSDILMESCCKHATFPCWSFFHTRDGFKSFSSE